MDKGILFSIIIPTYNRASLLSQALRSIQAQESNDFEVVVVDYDANSDTKNVFGEFSFLGSNIISLTKNVHFRFARF